LSDLDPDSEKLCEHGTRTITGLSMKQDQRK